MGQARSRGTLEQRVAQAKARAATEIERSRTAKRSQENRKRYGSVMNYMVLALAAGEM